MFVMIPWWILFILIKYSLVNCNDYLCNNIVNKSDNTLDICISNECNQFLDPYSIMVKPNNCKTKILYLSFSSYKMFSLFLDRIQWKLTDLFPSKLNNEIRQLRIYIKKIDFDDQPIDHNELIRLGINIDLYELYLQNITNKNYLYELIHYDSNYPEWDIIKIRFICKSFLRFYENSCGIQIISPSFLAPRRPLLTTQIIPLLTTIQLSSSSIEQSNQQYQRSIHLIIIILIPLLIILISIFIIVKRCSKKNSTAKSSSIPSISHDLDSKNGLYSECRPTAKPYQVSRLPSPHLDSLYKESQRNF